MTSLRATICVPPCTEAHAFRGVNVAIACYLSMSYRARTQKIAPWLLERTQVHRALVTSFGDFAFSACRTRSVKIEARHLDFRLYRAATRTSRRNGPALIGSAGRVRHVVPAADRFRGVGGRHRWSNVASNAVLYASSPYYVRAVGQHARYDDIRRIGEERAPSFQPITNRRFISRCSVRWCLPQWLTNLSTRHCTNARPSGTVEPACGRARARN